MLDKADIIKWRSEKAERGRAVGALSYAHNRVGLIRIHQEAKKNIKETTKAYSGMGCHLREMIFEFFNKVELEICLMKSLKAGQAAKNGLSVDDQKTYARWMEVAFRHGVAARAIRFTVGNPLIFSNGERPFWVDPTSGYVPPDQLGIAKEYGIEFHTITVRIPHGVVTNLVNKTEGRRGHCGLWSAYRDEENEDPAKQPYIFAFESATDLIEFRFRYEFEQVN